MTRFTTASIALAVGAIPAAADIQSQQVEYSWDVQAANEPAVLQFSAFDDMGGTRLLTGVNVSLEGFYSLNMLAENLEEEAITSDQWFVEAATLMQVGFGELALGALDVLNFGLLSADLAANDGVALEGPDSVFWAFKGEVSGEANILPEDFTAFTRGDFISADLYPFLSLAITPPPPLFDLYITDHIHFGSLTLNYEYTDVPAPSALSLLSITGVACMRRRRPRRD